MSGVDAWRTRYSASADSCRRSPAMALQPGDDLPHQGGGLRGSLAHFDAGGLQSLLLALGGAGTRRHDGTGVAHRLALRSREPGDVADDRLRHVLADERRGPLFRVAA